MKKNFKFANRVLKDFKKESPSQINIKKKYDFKKYLTMHENLFNNLKFPLELFKNKKVIDLGCGTGEVDFVLNKFGAKLECLDFNGKSIDYAKKLKKKLKLKNINFRTASIEEYKVKKKHFDISTSFGVITHVYDQEGLFKKLVNSTKKKGYIILGFVEDAGLIQRLLHRAIIRKLSNKSEKEIYVYAKKLFREHLDRSMKFGMRTYRGIINDYLVNQAYYGLSSTKLHQWAQKYNLEFYSSSPEISLPLRIDPGIKDQKIKSTKLKIMLNSIFRLRSIFSQQSDEEVYNNLITAQNNKLDKDIESFINLTTHILQKSNNNASKKELKKLNEVKKKIKENIKFSFKNLEKNIASNFFPMSNEIFEIIKEINNKKISFRSIKKKINFLFKGYNGLGTSYYIFKKN